jgi:hypothetical protein
MYLYVLTCTLVVYVPICTFGKFSHGSTYQYVLVQIIDQKLRTSTYEYLLFAVHGSTISEPVCAHLVHTVYTVHTVHTGGGPPGVISNML